jgi:hypothetical protein
VSGLLVLGVSLLGLTLPSGASAAACQDEYSGPSGGSWSEAANWSAGIPGPGSVVCWDAGKTVVVADGAQSAASIASGGALIVQRTARLDLGAGPDPSALAGTVQAAGGGGLELHGRLSCAGAAAAGGGTIVDDGALECPLSVAGGGRLSGVGSVVAVTNEGGVVEPGDGAAPGGLDAGSYSQGAAGTLSVRQEATAGGLSDHLLRVRGTATLSGTVSLAPASPPAGFLVIDSGSEPEGYFTHVGAPVPGSPWTIAYGAHGAIAISGGSVPVSPAISGSLEAGGTVTCGLGAALWAPRGEVAYSWSGPIFPPTPIAQGTSAPLPGRRGGFLAEQLDPELDAAKGAAISLPGNAVGFQIGCSIRYWMPAGGAQPSVTAGGDSAPTLVAGAYRSVHAPAITGRAVPRSRLTCSPGRWEGTPTSITYAWMWARQEDPESARWFGLGAGAGHTVTAAEGGGTLACIVTAHYGSIAVPAEASVQVPPRPQPTLCARRALTLTSARRTPGAVLLFGAAVQRNFGRRVVLSGRAAAHGRWRRVASARVDDSGYFELRVPTGTGGLTRGSFRAAIGRTVSNVLELPGLLQIVSDRSSPGSSLVALRLARGARGGARVTVSPLGRECAAGAPIVSATLAAGADLSVRLTAQRGAGEGYYLARASARGRTQSVELIVPGLPQPLPG